MAYINRGAARSNQAQYEQALADLNQAIRLNPREALAYSHRGAAATEMKRFEQALRDLNEAIRGHDDRDS
jgi:tetratricopeptide (TPR) repeat protein